MDNLLIPSYNSISNNSNNSSNSNISNNSNYYDIDISNNILELQNKGYTIIPNVYNEEEITEYKMEFFEWYYNVPYLNYLHYIIDFNGIFKHHQVGHQRFAWLARTNPKIINIFKKIWNTEELITSFDGCCYYPSNHTENENYWTHTDQSPLKEGLNCYQSFLSLTNNSRRTFIVYQNSHLLHHSYFKNMNIQENNDFCIIDQNYINQISKTKTYIQVNAGDLVIWDSRTFHQNCCESNEERLIQYLCYLPKNHILNTDKEQEKRKILFQNLRTTSHWVYPMRPIPEQPNYYNYNNKGNEIYIDYNILKKPYLDDLLPDIYKLI